MEVSKLYPQLNTNDRRQQDIPVDKDRRIGMDRRETTRPTLDLKLGQDIERTKQIFAPFLKNDEYLRQSDNNKQNKNNNNLVMEGVLSVIPATRRITTVENNKDNPIKAVGLTLIGLINLKEDFRDLMSIIGRTKSEAPEDYYALYKFFTGTILEAPLEKTNIGRFIVHKLDKPISDTKACQIIRSLLDVKEEQEIFQKEVKLPFGKSDVVIREYVKHEGSFIGRLACLTMNRITKLGLIFMSLLEIPAIYKSVKNKKDYSQIPKSAINVTSCVICGASFSALLSLLTHSPAGSVIGLGVGLFIGDKLSKQVNYFLG